MRIYFTHADLARTHLAEGPDPMWELVASVQTLQTRYGRQVFGRWRQQVAAELTRTQLTARVRAHLLPVAPAASYFPDLLTPSEAALGLDAAIDTILHTPRRRLGNEIGRLTGGPGADQWLADLAAGRVAAMAALGELIRAYHRCAIQPYWRRLRLWVDNDLAARRQLVRDGGVERLLDGFRPRMLWQYPILEIPLHPSDREVHLDGRGLLLVPSYFCWEHPMTIFDPALPQIVLYPVNHAKDWLEHGPDLTDRPALDRLLGRTRAVVLLATQGGRTTTELARCLGMSEPTISHHTRILREAGLITSQRTANTVLHILNPLGAALLRQRQHHE